MADLAVYLHWPFCAAKCPYCDFNVHVRERIDADAWALAYGREIAGWADTLPGRQVISVFFGGGTPSLMPVATVETVLRALDDRFGIATDAEITLEANPNSADAGRFAGYRRAGVNRLSLGVQALDDPDLKALGRLHDAGEARAAIELAGRLFDRFSFDLIYARPGQSLAAWRRELGEALALAGDHLSLYQLTIEPNTVFASRVRTGALVPMEDDSAADFFALTQEITNAAGLPAYEISNHARPGGESRHNLTYWHYGDYLGIGPGAHGRITLAGRKIATRAHRAPEIWLERALGDGETTSRTPLSDIDSATERLLMGLRLTDGIAAGSLLEPAGFVDQAMLDRLVSAGLLSRTADRIALTERGRPLLDGVLAGLLAGER